MNQVKEHWETVYSSKQENELGWFQPKADISLNLIRECNLSPNDIIIDAGSGASVLIDDLLEEGFKELIATDISVSGLNKSKQRLGPEKSSQVKWLVDDLTSSKELIKLKNVSLWHDRAVFHFLIDKKQQREYLKLIDKIIKVGGYVIISTFAKDGALKCSGLNVGRYDELDLAQTLGENYKLVKHIRHLHFNPKAEHRPFIYTLFKKIK